MVDLTLSRYWTQLTRSSGRMRARHAREIRQAIHDARHRRFSSWFSCTQRGYEEADRHPLYMAAHDRTTRRMPPPQPPQG